MKNTIIILVGLIIIGAGAYWFMGNKTETIPQQVVVNDSSNTTVKATSSTSTTVVASTTTTTKSETVIGTSVQGESITAYHFGTGEKEILFVGGIHGGYEWNSSLVAYQLMDYLKANPQVIPTNVKVTVIPVLNPDGLKKVVGTTAQFSPAQVSTSESVVISGRYNANKVDLNRNFDCEWKTTGVWQTTKVSGGSSTFSEPESKAIKEYVEKHPITAAVVWYSAGGGVYASSCHNGISTETNTLMRTYANASGYKAYNSFDFYATTGDMVNWLAKINVPAISVLLTTHTDTEWSKNQAGIDALLKSYTK